MAWELMGTLRNALIIQPTPRTTMIPTVADMIFVDRGLRGKICVGVEVLSWEKADGI